MLLLVLDAELDQFDQGSAGRAFEKGRHGVVDVAPVGGDLFDSGSRHQTPVVARIPGSDSLVVRVEQESEVGMEHPVVRLIG